MIGNDLLGLAHEKMDVKLMIQLTPAGWAIGTFDDPFGDVLPKLKKMMDTGKYPVVRIHAHWDDNHKICPLDKLKKKLPRYEQLAKDYPKIKVYVSHSCEYNESSASEVKKRVDLVKQLCPSCIPVNSRWKGATTPGVLTESHGSKAKAKEGEIVSTDGENIYDIDVETWFKDNSKAAIIFLWGFRYNLREIPDPGQKVPKPKDRNASPNKQYTQGIIRLGSPKGSAPVPVFKDKKITPIKSPDIWKTYAEDDQEENPLTPDDPRENRPVLIVKSKAKVLQIVTKDDKVIGKIPEGGKFGTNQNRFYSGGPGGVKLYGAEIAAKALKESGSEFVWFKDGDSYIGPVNPAFRDGSFR